MTKEESALKALTSIFRMGGPYFMVGLEPDGRVRVDGGHSKPQGVAQAKHLHESISVIKPPDGTEWFMVKVEPIPEFQGKVNQDAIDTLNQNVKAPPCWHKRIGDDGFCLDCSKRAAVQINCP